MTARTFESPAIAGLSSFRSVVSLEAIERLDRARTGAVRARAPFIHDDGGGRVRRPRTAFAKLGITSRAELDRVLS